MAMQQNGKFASHLPTSLDLPWKPESVRIDTVNARDHPPKEGRGRTSQMKTKRLLDYVDRLIAEGKAVNATKHDTKYSRDVVEPTAFAKWLMGCRHLLQMLGKFAEPWAEPFADSLGHSDGHRARGMGATLEAI